MNELWNVSKIECRKNCIYILFNIFRHFISAVQHERGPRKPKLQQQTSNQLHHSPPMPLPHLPSSVDKLPSVSNGSFHFNPGLFVPPHHSLKTLSFPPPPPVGSPPSHLESGNPLHLPIFHHTGLPPPPGLLHILMSAEKCQVRVDNLFKRN